LEVPSLRANREDYNPFQESKLLEETKEAKNTFRNSGTPEQLEEAIVTAVNDRHQRRAAVLPEMRSSL
jgi:hypothetical protein